MAPSADNSNDNDIVVPLAVSLGVGIPLILTTMIIVWVTIRHRRVTREEDERFKNIDFEGDVTMSGERDENITFDTKDGTSSVIGASFPHYPQGNAKPHQRPYIHRDDSSSFLYTPYMNDDAISIEDYSRSVHNLMGRSRTPVFAPHQQKLRHAYSASSVSITASSQSPTTGPRLSSASSSNGMSSLPQMRQQREGSFASSQEWPPIVDSLPPTASRALQDSVTSSAATSVDQRHEPIALFGTSGVRSETNSRGTEQQLLPRTVEEDEFRSATKSTSTVALTASQSHIQSTPADSTANQSQSMESLISRNKSRGHAVVLDLYDVYRNKSKGAGSEQNIRGRTAETIHKTGNDGHTSENNVDSDSLRSAHSSLRRESAVSTVASSAIKDPTQSGIHRSHNSSISATDYEEHGSTNAGRGRAEPLGQSQTSLPISAGATVMQQDQLVSDDSEHDSSNYHAGTSINTDHSFVVNEEPAAESQTGGHNRSFSYEITRDEFTQLDLNRNASPEMPKHAHTHSSNALDNQLSPSSQEHHHQKSWQQQQQQQQRQQQQQQQQQQAVPRPPPAGRSFSEYTTYSDPSRGGYQYEKESIRSPVVDQMISQLPTPPSHYHPTSSHQSLRSSSPHRSPQIELAATFDNFQVPTSASSSSLSSRSHQAQRPLYAAALPREAVLDESVFMERTRKYDNTRIR